MSEIIRQGRRRLRMAMILSALSDEFRALFGRLPARRIALWFDEKREFERLLPAFEKHLSGHAALPFTLLRYDEQAGHGQLWIKHEIHWASRQLPAAERQARRYVVRAVVVPDFGGW